MKDNYYGKLLVICFLILAICFFFVLGVFSGYYSGQKSMANYMISIAGKVHVDNVTISFNQTKMDEALDFMKNVTSSIIQIAKNKTI